MENEHYKQQNEYVERFNQQIEYQKKFMHQADANKLDMDSMWELTDTYLDEYGDDDIAIYFLSDLIVLATMFKIIMPVPVRYILRFISCPQERSRILRIAMENERVNDVLIFDQTNGTVFIPNAEYHLARASNTLAEMEDERI